MGIELFNKETGELIIDLDASDVGLRASISSDTYKEYKPIKFDNKEFTFTVDDCCVNKPMMLSLINPVNAMSFSTFILYVRQILDLIIEGKTVNELVINVTLDEKIPFRTFVPVVKPEERERLYRDGLIINVMDYINRVCEK